MNRTRFGLTGVVALGFGSLLALACNGKVSVGSNGGPEAQGVSSSELSTIAQTTVAACGSGYAHPNLCCAGGACVTYPTAVFNACAAGASTFPDPRTCCDINGSGDSNDCQVPPPASGTSPVTACVLPCPVAQVAQSSGGSSVPNQVGSGSGSSGGGTVGSGSGTGSTPVICNGNGPCDVDAGTPTGSGSGSGAGGEPWPVCCGYDSNGDVLCAAPAATSCACACPADGPCPPCNCPDEPVQPLQGCNACPTGWNPPTVLSANVTADLCCRQDPSTGQIDCFSQGVPPPSSGGSSGGASTEPTEAGVVLVSGDAEAPSDACLPLPCPSGAPWNPTTCSCD